MRYFHELTGNEREQLVAAITPECTVLARFKQPNWCAYPGIGCWSLLRGRIRQETDCVSCDLFKPYLGIYRGFRTREMLPIMDYFRKQVELSESVHNGDVEF